MSTSKRKYNPQFLFIQHDASCPPELGAKALQLRGIDFQVTYANYPNAFKYITPSMFKGIVVLGGHQGAYEDDKYPWFKELKSFLKDALAENIPILGLCLGAQFLAGVIGGDNFVGTKGSEFGYYDIKYTSDAQNDEFCSYIRKNGLDKTMPYTHGDTFTLPKCGYYQTRKGERIDVKLLGMTKTPYIAMFKVGELSYGIQAHPEADYELHDIWTCLDVDEIAKIGKTANDVRKESKSLMNVQDKNGRLLHEKWFDLCMEKAMRDNNRIQSKL